MCLRELKPFRHLICKGALDGLGFLIHISECPVIGLIDSLFDGLPLQVRPNANEIFTVKPQCCLLQPLAHVPFESVYVLLHQLGAQALTLYAGQLRQECPTGRILVDLSALHAPEGILDPCLCTAFLWAQAFDIAQIVLRDGGYIAAEISDRGAASQHLANKLRALGHGGHLVHSKFHCECAERHLAHSGAQQRELHNQNVLGAVDGEHVIGMPLHAQALT
mmetsp:Transcript_62619/g.103250  ORF Transcript_62619/g.103250 Transcript_62619/m.103250 type:complete len:221 (-) Transcript_62619:762-1424(-)